VTAPISMRDFARVVLPWDAQDAGLFMLTAYFDDSGTHGTSDVVVLGGLLGNQYKWQSFSEAWAEKLRDPSPGKPPLTRFHMADCQAGLGEFAGWGRTATDFLVHELGTIILKHMLWGYGCAVSRKAWDEFVTGDLRRALGDSEGFCARNCYVQSVEICRTKAWQSELAFVFDDRPHRYVENKRIFDVFKQFSQDNDKSPSLASLTFVPSLKFPPLQAADMVAWEMYQQALAINNGSVGPNDQYIRKQFDRIARGRRFRFQFAFRDEIVRMVNSPARGDVKVVGDYFSDGFPPGVGAEQSS
jgi:Protein of unknown function (DUF3800)